MSKLSISQFQKYNRRETSKYETFSYDGYKNFYLLLQTYSNLDIFMNFGSNINIWFFLSIALFSFTSCFSIDIWIICVMSKLFSSKRVKVNDYKKVKYESYLLLFNFVPDSLMIQKQFNPKAIYSYLQPKLRWPIPQERAWNLVW